MLRQMPRQSEEAVSAFISIHILFLVFDESLSWPLGIINIMSEAHWSELSQWTAPQHKCTNKQGEDELCQKQMLFISNAAVAGANPRGPMFLIPFASSNNS